MRMPGRILLAVPALLAGALLGAGFLFESPLLRVGLAGAGLLLMLRQTASCQSPARGAVSGFAFGFAWFAVSLHWIYFSVHLYGHVPAFFSVLAVAAFAALLALFPAAAAALAALAEPKGLKPAAFAGGLVLAEYLRETVLTGFPWASPGYAFLDTPFEGFAPYAGHLGVAAAALAAAVLLQGLGYVRSAKTKMLLAAGAAAVVLAGQFLGERDFSRPYAKLDVELIEPDFPVFADPRTRREAVREILSQTRQAQIVFFPESTYLELWENLPASEKQFLERFAREHQAGVVLNAFDRRGPGLFTNSIFAVDADAIATYDKHHLVPFGEFVPPGFGWFVRALGIPMSDLHRGVGGHTLYTAGHALSVSLCYENLFPTEWFAKGNLPEALVNLTNLKWFHTQAAPTAHRAVSRMRALEASRPVVYVANHGMSAVIDEKGRVQRGSARAPAGRIAAQVVTRTGPDTPFVRFGHVPATGFAALILVLILALRGRRKR